MLSEKLQEVLNALARGLYIIPDVGLQENQRMQSCHVCFICRVCSSTWELRAQLKSPLLVVYLNAEVCSSTMGCWYLRHTEVPPCSVAILVHLSMKNAVCSE